MIRTLFFFAFFLVLVLLAGRALDIEADMQRAQIPVGVR